MSTLYVVGIGPGSEEYLTIKAQKVLEQSNIIVGYKAYIDIVAGYEHMDGKEFISTGMRSEVDRCKLALEAASSPSNTVAMVCSGDAGIYGMAGILYQLLDGYPEVSLEVIPGVTAALSGSALLGAAVGHDLAIISLSDLLTPWELIEKRLRAAALADFVIAIYNPASHKRADYLKKAVNIILEYKSDNTICGIARNIGREGESAEVLTLSELENAEVDMFCTVFIGNSQTTNIDGYMVTPRGYMER